MPGISDDPLYHVPDPLPEPADPTPDLDDPHGLDDLALDFVEEAVGRLDFQRNWPTIGADQSALVSRWLSRRRYPPDLAEPLRRQVDYLHRTGARWPQR